MRGRAGTISSEVRQRQEAEAETLADLTGWDLRA